MKENCLGFTKDTQTSSRNFRLNSEPATSYYAVPPVYLSYVPFLTSVRCRFASQLLLRFPCRSEALDWHQ